MLNFGVIIILRFHELSSNCSVRPFGKIIKSTRSVIFLIDQIHHCFALPSLLCFGHDVLVGHLIFWGL